jgi:hypothetical protein
VPLFGATFFLSKSYVLILAKNLCSILVKFFTNSSGHPATQPGAIGFSLRLAAKTEMSDLKPE